MSAHHESFLDAHSGAVAHVDKYGCFISSQRNRLLTKNVLTSFRSPRGPRYMQVIWKRVVNRFDISIREQLFITSVDFLYSEVVSRFFCLCQIAGGDDSYLTPGA